MSKPRSAGEKVFDLLLSMAWCKKCSFTAHKIVDTIPKPDKNRLMISFEMRACKVHLKLGREVEKLLP